MASIASDPDRFFLAVLDLNLPDAPDGEVVDYVLAHQIPVVVLTGHYDDATRERMLAKNDEPLFLRLSGSQVHDFQVAL
jgi:hypothetical protein